MKYTLIVFFVFSLNMSFGQKLVLSELDCKISEEGKQQIAQILEYEFQFYEKFLNIKRDVEIKVSIYGNEEVYKTTQKMISTSTSNSAFYSNKHNQILINYRPGRTEAKVLSVIAHESSHFILKSDGTKIPKWINEGMSEYFEQAYLKPNKSIDFNEPADFVAFIYDNFSKDKINIKQFIGWSDDKWKAVNKNKSFSYRLSWGLVNYLFVNGKIDIVKRILKDLKENPNNGQNIVNEAYSGGIDQLEKDMKTYYNEKYEFNKNSKIEIKEDLDVDLH